MSSFRSFVWDPLLIISQIFALQTTFYTTISLCLLVYGNIFAYEPSLAHVFSVQTLRVMVVSQLIASIVCSFMLGTVVQRAKQCLDFACTLHTFHVLFSCIYSLRFPSFLWCILQIASATISTVLGEYLCMRSESREIRLGAPSKYDL